MCTQCPALGSACMVPEQPCPAVMGGIGNGLQARKGRRGSRWPASDSCGSTWYQSGLAPLSPLLWMGRSS